MLEFCDKDFLVILAVNRAQYEIYTLGELAPLGFSLERKTGQKGIVQNDMIQNNGVQNNMGWNNEEQNNVIRENTTGKGLKLW